MIERIINFSLKNRLMIMILVAGIAFSGYWTLKKLPIDAFPDITPPMVQIFTVSPGLSPVDVETLISYPIEISMYGLPKLKRVQSTSIFGLSRVNIYFEDGTDVYFSRRLVLERLQEARKNIPEGLGDPKLGPITTGLGQVLMYSLKVKKGYNHSLMELREIQDWIVKPRLRTILGITEVLGVGGYVRQFQVKVDINALLARNLTLADVRKALISNNRNVGGSFIERAGDEFLVRGFGWIRPGEQGLRDIRNIIVAEKNGIPVTIGQIATVGFGPEIRRGVLVHNGKEVVGAIILKLYGANTQILLDKIKKEIDEINKALPDGIELVPFYSQAELVKKATGTVKSALLQGAVLVLIFLYLFLGNALSTFIVISTLPLSALIAFIGMKFIGLSANLMSLGGLAIGIGIIVDGAVIVTENVFRHIEERKRAGEDISIVRLVGEAARQVARPVTFSISIIIIVFLPLFTLQGTEKIMFSPMAYTISFALAGALFLDLTMVPVICALLLRTNIIHEEPKLARLLKQIYRPILRKAIKHPVWVVSVAIVLLLSSLAIFPFLGTEFIPTLREGTITVRSVLPPGANLSTGIGYAKRIQMALKEFPEVTDVYCRVGRPEIGGDPEPVNVVMTVVLLKPLNRWKSGRSYEQLQSAIAKKLKEEVPGLANNVSQPIQLRTDELMTGIKAQIAISIYGEDLNKLAEIGKQVRDICDTIPGAVDVRMQQQSGKPQVVIRPIRSRLARLGISVDEFLEIVEAGIGGVTVGQVFEGMRRFDVFLRLREDQRARLDLIKQLPIQTPSGKIMPLDQIADVNVFIGPKMISRNKASRRIFVQLNVRGRDMGSVVKDIQKAIQEKLRLPPGYFIEYGGQFENQQRAMKRLYIVVPVTLGLIFLMLFSAFGSLRYAILILFNVPFALIGGIFSLFISGLYLSVPAAVGFIAVFGVAVLDGVVLVDYINKLRETGMELEKAVITGSEHRLRPVLMTSCVAIFGLIPLLISNDIGSNVQRPLTAVVVGGLFTSTLLTLLVLPSIYKWFAGPIEEIEI